MRFHFLSFSYVSWLSCRSTTSHLYRVRDPFSDRYILILWMFHYTYQWIIHWGAQLRVTDLMFPLLAIPFWLLGYSDDRTCCVWGGVRFLIMSSQHFLSKEIIVCISFLPHLLIRPLCIGVMFGHTYLQLYLTLSFHTRPSKSFMHTSISGLVSSGFFYVEGKCLASNRCHQADFWRCISFQLCFRTRSIVLAS